MGRHRRRDRDERGALERERLGAAHPISGGDVTVDAEHLAQIDATSTSRIEAWTAYSLVVAFNSLGWIPTNIFFTAADTLTSASDYFYDWSSNDEPAVLHHGDKVRVDSGPHAGQVFEYPGWRWSPGPST